MTTTTQQVPATVQHILDAGTIAYVPGGFKKFEEGKTYRSDCFTLPVLEFRRDVLVRHKTRSSWVDKVNAIIVDVTDAHFMAKHRCREVVTVGCFGEFPSATGEYCVPVRDLALHWVDGERFEAAKAAVDRQTQEANEWAIQRIQRHDAILRRFAKELGLAGSQFYTGARPHYSGLSTDHGTGDNITISAGAFKTLCEKLGIDLETIED
jgi:hypothetical protein